MLASKKSALKPCRGAPVAMSLLSFRHVELALATRAAVFVYGNNYLIDVKFGVIVDVEASGAIRQAEVGAGSKIRTKAENFNRPAR